MEAEQHQNDPPHLMYQLPNGEQTRQVTFSNAEEAKCAYLLLSEAEKRLFVEHILPNLTEEDVHDLMWRIIASEGPESASQMLQTVKKLEDDTAREIKRHNELLVQEEQRIKELSLKLQEGIPPEDSFMSSDLD